MSNDSMVDKILEKTRRDALKYMLNENISEELTKEEALKIYEYIFYIKEKGKSICSEIQISKDNIFELFKIIGKVLKDNKTLDFNELEIRKNKSQLEFIDLEGKNIYTSELSEKTDESEGFYQPSNIYYAKTVLKYRQTKIKFMESEGKFLPSFFLEIEKSFYEKAQDILDEMIRSKELKRIENRILYTNAIEKIKKYTVEMPNGKKVVLAPEMIIAGSMIAYEKGISYYVSVSEHFDKNKNVDGVTFAITSKPGSKLPKEVLDFGNLLVNKYRIDKNSSEVFVNPNGQMIVAGGIKNPEFKITNETVKGMLSKIENRFMGKDMKKDMEEDRSL